MQIQYTYGGTSRKARRRSHGFLGVGIIILAIAMVVGFVILLSEPEGDGKVKLTSNDLEKDLTADGGTVEVEARKLPSKLDFQALAENWVNSTSGRKSVYIYDLDYDTPIAAVNETANYNTASLYKLFPVYEGYKRVYDGEWKTTDVLVAGRTIGECLDAAIRSSDSTCGEALWNKINRYELDKIIKNSWGITNSQISGLSSNPVDIAKLLQRYWFHPDFDNETLLTIMDSMLNQPPVNNGMCSGPCVWRQGLPAGLSGDNVLVYDKVGWEHSGTSSAWNYYHDAAFVVSGDHHLIVVVMTANLSSFNEIVNFGTQLREALQS
ncbi:MAG: serine hydrolase [Candidatus Saccharibacteria bacterium]|nr:serine hydrolase [Candidatus Saccharibacteria bacterium]